MALVKSGGGSSTTTHTLQLTGNILTSTVNGVSDSADLSTITVNVDVTLIGGVFSVNSIPVFTGVEQRDSFGNLLGYMLPPV